MTVITGMLAILAIYIGLGIATMFGLPLWDTVETVYAFFLVSLVAFFVFALFRWVWKRPVPASELLVDIGAFDDFAARARQAVAPQVKSLAKMIEAAMTAKTGFKYLYQRYVIDMDKGLVRLDYDGNNMTTEAVYVPFDMFDKSEDKQRAFAQAVV